MSLTVYCLFFIQMIIYNSCPHIELDLFVIIYCTELLPVGVNKIMVDKGVGELRIIAYYTIFLVIV